MQSLFGLYGGTNAQALHGSKDADNACGKSYIDGHGGIYNVIVIFLCSSCWERKKPGEGVRRALSRCFHLPVIS